MRPDNGSVLDRCASVECSITPPELFQDIGLLIVEGRVPDACQNGRREGYHCWPPVNGRAQSCCQSKSHTRCRTSLCDYASKGRQLMKAAYATSQRIQISCFVDHSSCDPVPKVDRLHHDVCPGKEEHILIEQWRLQVDDASKVTTHGSIQALFQALRSFLHFSQLSAWWIKSQGASPANAYYRIETSFVDDTSQFRMVPDVHVFPLTTIAKDAAITVTVLSLPRVNFHLIGQELTPRTKPNPAKPNRMCRLVGSTAKPPTCRSLFPDSSARRAVPGCESMLCTNQSGLQRGGQSVQENGYIRNLLCSTAHQPHGNSRTSMEKDITPVNTKDVDGHDRHDGGAMACSAMRDMQFDMPPNRSASMNISNVHQSLAIGSSPLTKHQEIVVLEAPSPQSQDLHSYGYSPIHGCKCGLKSRRATIAVPRGVRATRRSLRECTMPVFNPTTGLPVSSSPAPLRRPDTCAEIEHNFNDFCEMSRTSFSSSCCCDSADESESPDAFLSKSAPASTGLLGNFEESILKGRMPASGTVAGFTIELGASGSFCPCHVTLPVRAHFFRISDDGMPSPYLGFISLKDPRVGRRGYHIPRQGTVQLTLFNPNKTVVKVFVVLYNLGDMPTDSHTFLRQKIVSSRSDSDSEGEQRSLHYLVHLRFACSKRGRIYLHSDIRLLFPRQPPEVNPFRSLLTITDEPKNPRYSRLGRTGES